MSDADEQKCPECKPGLPAWLATFADLMSLLMCFFVLLLSFAEMDVIKFKRLAGSMRNAFGVQDQVQVEDIPKGTSIIAQEFSPGRPEPTPLQTVMQHTTQPDQPTLEVMCAAQVEQAVQEACVVQSPQSAQEMKEEVVTELREVMEKAEAKALELAVALEKQIETGEVEIESKGRKIVIRLQEKGSFDSGSAELRQDFLPVLIAAGEVLRDMEGQISVEGHTDSVPIKTRLFPSNWHLSTARALSVASALMDEMALDPMRFSVSGYADTRPLIANDTPENRALNRRVEIVLQQALSEELKEKFQRAREQTPNLLQDRDLRRFELSPGEIF